MEDEDANSDDTPQDQEPSIDEEEALQADMESIQEELDQALNEIDRLEDELEEKDNEIERLREERDEAESAMEESSAATNEGEPSDLQERSVQVVDALSNENFEQLADYVHPEDGVMFSPYSNLDDQAAHVMTAEEISQWAEDQSVYTWGVEDGSGQDIDLTPSEYYNQFLFIRDFSSPDEVNQNQFESRGQVSFNGHEVFPDAEFVEYFVESTDDDLDWASLQLGFEEQNGEWYVVTIMIDRWTT